MICGERHKKTCIEQASKLLLCFGILARLARFERATAWFVARYSIQLSYRRVEGRYYREEPVLSQGLKGRFRRPCLLVSEHSPNPGSTGGRIDQNTRIHHALWVQYLAGAGEGLAKQGGNLVVVT